MNVTISSWFKLYNEFAVDPKVQSMSEALQRRLIMLLCMKSANQLDAASEEELMFVLRITGEELKETKEIFVRKGFIEVLGNGSWMLRNWDKRQAKEIHEMETKKRSRPKIVENKSGLLDLCISQPNQDSQFYIFLCGDEKWWPDTSEIDRWKACYPNIDVNAEILKASDWTESNKSRRPRHGKRFLSAWLAKTDERAVNRKAAMAADSSTEAFDFSEASDEFVALYESYPPNRRSNLVAAYEGWTKYARESKDLGKAFDEAINGLLRWKQSDDWLRDGGRYIPGISRFICERRWMNAPDENCRFGSDRYRNSYGEKTIFDSAS